MKPNGAAAQVQFFALRRLLSEKGTETIEDFLTVPPRLHHTHGPKDGKMMGGVGLTEFQTVRQVSNAPLLFHKQGQNLQPGLVAESLQKLCAFCRRFRFAP